jgi:hypothetical protein
MLHSTCVLCFRLPLSAASVTVQNFNTHRGVFEYSSDSHVVTDTAYLRVNFANFYSKENTS